MKTNSSKVIICAFVERQLLGRFLVELKCMNKLQIRLKFENGLKWANRKTLAIYAKKLIINLV